MALLLSLPGNSTPASPEFPLDQRQFLLSLLHVSFKSLHSSQQAFAFGNKRQEGGAVLEVTTTSCCALYLHQGHQSLLPAQMGDGGKGAIGRKIIFPKLLPELKMLRSYTVSLAFLPICPNLTLTMKKHSEKCKLRNSLQNNCLCSSKYHCYQGKRPGTAPE